MKTTEPLVKSALIAAVVALPLAAHAQHVGIGIRIGVPAPVYVAAPPPVVYQETVYAAPAPGYVLVPAHYVWRGRWVLVHAHWEMPPQPGCVWVAGAYQGQNWVEAHWAYPEVAPPPAPPPPPGMTSDEVVVTEAPPPPINEEVVGVAPGPDYLWLGGYWGWEGGHRIWVRGHWDRPPRHGAVWVQPRWEHRGGNYVFIRGYWR